MGEKSRSRQFPFGFLLPSSGNQRPQLKSRLNSCNIPLPYLLPYCASFSSQSNLYSPGPSSCIRMALIKAGNDLGHASQNSFISFFPQLKFLPIFVCGTESSGGNLGLGGSFPLVTPMWGHAILLFVEQKVFSLELMDSHLPIIKYL